MKIAKRSLTLLSFLTALTFASAQSSKPPLISQTFKDGVGGWVGYGQSAKLDVSHDPEITLPGAGALKLDYAVVKGDLDVLYLPAPLGSLTTAKSFKFRIRTDVTTLLAVTLQEQDGGRYVATLQTSKGKWQTVELSTSDFILAQDPGDPKDPDGKLDMDRVTGITIFDVSQFLVASDNPALEELFGLQKGSHAMYMDSFTVGVDPIPAGASSVGSDVNLETFAHPQLAWMGLGSIKVSQSMGAPLVGSAVKADYHLSPGKISLLAKPLPTWVLTGTKVLSFDVASTQPTKLVIQLEQYDGGKYNMAIEVPGGSVPQHKKLLLSGFTRGDDSKDSDTKLHLALVKQILIIDISGLVDQADRDNTIWVNHIMASASSG